MAFKNAMDYFHFSLLVQHRYRYAINEEVRTFLSNVVESLDSRVATVPEGQDYWRAQIGYEEVIDDISYEQAPHSVTRMKPDHKFSGNGRVSPKGIASLYLASTKETAMSEVRPWKKAEISCARFVTTRELKIIDCSVHAGKNLLFLSANTPQDIQEAIWGSIDNAFSRPVSVDEEAIEYVPTQILAELFKSQGYDGVGYKSSLRADGYNLALFDLESATMVNCQIFTVDSILFEFSESSQLMRVNKND